MTVYNLKSYEIEKQRWNGQENRRQEDKKAKQRIKENKKTDLKWTER